MKVLNFVRHRASVRFARLLLVLASLILGGALSGCGAAGGGSATGGSVSPSPSPPPLDSIAKIELGIHTDNAPADGEMVNVVIIKGKNSADEPVSGFTPALNVMSGVEVTCYAANMLGEAVCFLKSTTAGKVTVSVNNLISTVLGLDKTITVTFKEKKAQRPGNQVGGSASVSVGRVDPLDSSGPVLAQVTSVMGEFVSIPEGDSATTAALKDASLPPDDPLSSHYYYRLISNLLGTVIWE